MGLKRSGPDRWMSFAVPWRPCFLAPKWKYQCPRAYAFTRRSRTFLSTFCLVATWTEPGAVLHSFTPDSCIEKALRIDGITESFVVCCGSRCRPANREWNPLLLFPECHACRFIRRISS